MNEFVKPGNRTAVPVNGLSERLAPYFGDTRVISVSDRIAPYSNYQLPADLKEEDEPNIIFARDISDALDESLMDDRLTLPLREPRKPRLLTKFMNATSARATIALQQINDKKAALANTMASLNENTAELAKTALARANKNKAELANTVAYLNQNKVELAKAALSHANKNKAELATGFAISASVSLATRLSVVSLATAAGASVGLSAILAAGATGAVMGVVKYERSRGKELKAFMEAYPDNVGSPLAPRWSKEYNRGLRNSILKSTVFSMGGGVLGAGFVSAMNHLTGGAASAFVIEKSGWLFDKLKAMGASISTHVKGLADHFTTSTALPTPKLPVVDTTPDSSVIFKQSSVKASLDDISPSLKSPNMDDTSLLLKQPEPKDIATLPSFTKQLPGVTDNATLKTDAFTPWNKDIVGGTPETSSILTDKVPDLTVKTEIPAVDTAKIELPKVEAAAPVLTTPDLSLADKTKALFDGQKLSKRMAALVAHAVDGDAQSQKDLAVKLLNGGHGVTKNPEAALELYRAAAAQGNVQAKVDLLYIKHHGLAGIEADPKGTITEIRPLARVNGHAKELLNDWTGKPKLAAVHKDAIEVRELPPLRVKPETHDVAVIPKPEPRPVMADTNGNDPLNSCKWKFNAKGQPVSASHCSNTELAAMLKSGNTIDVLFKPSMK